MFRACYRTHFDDEAEKERLSAIQYGWIQMRCGYNDAYNEYVN